MPWESADMGEQRVKFVVRAASGKERMATLCREFGVSRPTGYRWRRRFEQAGSVTAVVERSRRPEHSPSQTEPRKEDRVVALRQEHGWGAKKLEVLLREEGQPLTVITINRILKRRGLVKKKESHAPALQRLSAARRTNCGKWTARESIAEGMERVTRCRFSTIIVAMPWGCTVCAFLLRRRFIPAWYVLSNATACRKRC